MVNHCNRFAVNGVPCPIVPLVLDSRHDASRKRRTRPTGFERVPGELVGTITPTSA